MTTGNAAGQPATSAQRAELFSPLSEVFALNRGAINWSRALTFLPLVLVPLVVLIAVDQEQYFVSAIFGLLYVVVSDPGGDYGYRAPRMALFGLVGALLTALGFGLGTGGWGWVVLAAFAVTLGAGLTVKFGTHRFVAGLLLNIWFIIALSVAAGLADTHTTSHTWAQVLAWLGGSALWIAAAFVGWLARGREDRPPPIPEIPGDISPRPLTRPLVAFAVLRALAIAIAVVIPFGLDLPNADWMPIAAIVAMKPSLDQATLFAEQRLAGALTGAVVASILLVTIDSRRVLEAVVAALMIFAAATRFVNYAIYCAAIAAGVLIAIDLPHPADFGDEGERILYTFIGVGIGLLVMLLATALARRGLKSEPAPA